MLKDMAKDKYEGFEQNKRNKESYNAGGESLDARYDENFVYKHEENKITWTNEVSNFGAEANSFDSTLNQEEKGVEFEDNDKYKQNDSSSAEPSASSSSSSSSSVTSSSSTATAAGNSAGSIVHTVAVASTTAIIVVVGGGMVVNSQSYDKPQFVQIIEPVATKNTISFSLAVANSEEEAYQSSDSKDPEKCDVVVELTCDSYSSFSEERAISTFGIHDCIFDNLRTGTEYTISVAQRTFLDLNREYIIEPIKISTIPNIPVTMEPVNQTTVFHANSEFIFDGACLVTYDDDSTEEIANAKIEVDSSRVDMTTQGKYEVGLFYTESDVTISTSYEIEVIAGEINLTAEKEMTGALNFYVQVDMYVPTTPYRVFYLSLNTEYINYGANYEEIEQNNIELSSSTMQGDITTKQQVWFDVEDEQLTGVKYLALWGVKAIEGEMEEGMSEPPITYVEELLICKRVDFDNLDSTVMPIPQSLAVSGQTTTYHVEDYFTFDGVATVTYDDHSTEDVSSRVQVDTSSVNMERQGKYNVSLSFYSNNTNVFTNYQIEVLGGDFTISGEHDPFGNIDYFVDFDMYYSDPTTAYDSYTMLVTYYELNYTDEYEEEVEGAASVVNLNSQDGLNYQACNFQLDEYEEGDPTYFSLWGNRADPEAVTGDDRLDEMIACKLVDLSNINTVPKNENTVYVQRQVGEGDDPEFSYYAVATINDSYYDAGLVDNISMVIYTTSWNTIGYVRNFTPDAATDITSILKDSQYFDNEYGIYRFVVQGKNHDEEYVNDANAQNGSYTLTPAEGADYTIIQRDIDFSVLSEISVQTKPTIQEIELAWYHTPNNRDTYKPYVYIQKNDPGEHYEITGLNLIDVEDGNNTYLYNLSKVNFAENCYEITNGHDIYDPLGVSYLDKFEGDVGFEVVVNSDYEGNAGTGVVIDDFDITTTRADWQNSVNWYPVYLNLQYYGDPDSPWSAELFADLIGADEDFTQDQTYKVILTNIEDSTDTYEFDFDSDTGTNRYISSGDCPAAEGTYETAIYISINGVDTLLFTEVIDYSQVEFSA